jgi:ABC-type uncharacterized transport system involved in gliding motility auxiliary subunit
MNLKTTLLGLLIPIAACIAIALQVLYVNDTITYASWGLTLVIGAAWAALNQRLVITFLTRKSTRTGANVALIIFLVLGILVFINVIAHTHVFRKDLTRSGVNTLSEQSKKIVGALTQDVTAYFFTTVAEKEKGEDVLKRYSYVNPHFKYEFVDVDRKPTQAAAMGVKRKNTVVLALNDVKKLSVDQPTEEMVTNGLIKLFHADQVAVYFTSGHEEHPLEGDRDTLAFSNLKNEIGKQGYNVKEVNLFSEGKIPADAAVLIVGGPKKAFFPKELEILGDWIKNGGHAILMVDLDVMESGLSKGSGQIAELLKPYGVTVMSQMLVDPTSKMANVEPQVLLGFSGSKEHVITKDFAFSKVAANFLFPLTTYMVHDEKAPALITPLVVTTDQAWAESDWASLKKGSASYDSNTDHKGKMDLAYAIEGKKTEKPGEHAVKLVAFADAMFATNSLIDKVGNRDLILNSVAWLAGDENFISIRPVDEPTDINQYSSAMLSLIMLFTVYFVPLALIALGTFVWWRRSKL